MDFNINRFKQSVDNFFTLPQFGVDEKPKGYDMASENLVLYPSTNSDKTSKITPFINAKNALGVAKIASFVLFFPLGIGLLINTARKWMNEQELKGRVYTVQYKKIPDTEIADKQSLTKGTSKSDDSASKEKHDPSNRSIISETAQLARQLLNRESESQEEKSTVNQNKPNDDDATTSSSELQPRDWGKYLNDKLGTTSTSDEEH